MMQPRASAEIPVKAFAIAADVAARALGEPLANLFDAGSPSRARFVAIDAIALLYPQAAQIEIARCFGVTATGREFSGALQAARASAWWRAADVERALDEIRAGLGRITVGALLTGAEPVARFSVHESRTGDDDHRAKTYRKRDWHPIRRVLPGPKRPADLTAALLGDPPPGRREFLAGLESRGYSAGSEDRLR